MHHYRLKGLAHAAVLGGILSVFALPLGAQAPDNTKVNQRDRAKGAVTADQQKDNATDRDLTQRIRKSLMNDKSLSTYAHNIKVVSQGGHVTLKGPVRSAEEKASVEAKAVEVAGAGHVTNRISIAPEKPSKK